ncbi:MAG TPA: aspartate carbamoyltransferase catalytic subunit [Candidatus Limnocylindrales bacterium]|jgi:aspartate carbamoyltransferase catalytic subunit|nr:aspartate carbamoyltransferase catalytic subunit [Candidatus Limnocylindrales bacterium]
MTAPEIQAAAPGIDRSAMAADAGNAPGSPAEPAWPHRHLLDVDVLTWPQIELVLDTARHMAEIVAGDRPRSTALRGIGVTNLFYESSTRTRVSFEVAAKQLSADVVNVTVSGSSIEKGESLLDTMRTLEALGARILVMRHATSGAPHLVAGEFRGAVVNAGDGWHAHPTQALLDLYTLLRHLPGGSLRGRKVVILGDVLHSRVARSNLWTLTAAGADVWLCGPSTLLRGFEAWAAAGVAGERRFHVTSDVDAALRDADAVMALRIQKERMASGLLPSLGEYAARFGLTRERLASASAECIVMHPGPMNEGVEIAADVATGRSSVVTEQVANGVAIRMAVLALVASAAGLPAGGAA